MNDLVTHYWPIVAAIIGTHEANQFASAAFVTMPKPGTTFNLGALYAWFYDAVHQYANLRSKENPTRPA